MIMARNRPLRFARAQPPGRASSRADFARAQGRPLGSGL